MGDIENLIGLKNNLKNWSWNVEQKFFLDKNDARKLIEEIERIEMELYAIGVLRRAINE